MERECEVKILMIYEASWISPKAPLEQEKKKQQNPFPIECKGGK